MAISKRLRYEILRRDNYTCRYCGRGAPDVALTIDHIVPVTLGGSDDPDNLVAACIDCNAGKTSIAPDQALVEEVSELAVKLAMAVELVSEMRRDERAVVEGAVYAFSDMWNNYGNGHAGLRHVDNNWRTSIEKFISLGFNDEDLAHYARVSMDWGWTNRVTDAMARWKYFCGCCWKELASRQAEARLLVGEIAGDE